MADKLHRLFDEADGIHQLHAWHVFSTDELADIVVTSADIGRVARVTYDGDDTSSFYVFRGYVPEGESELATVPDWQWLSETQITGAQPAYVLATNQASESGTSFEAARADHVHGVVTGAPVAVGSANAEGTSEGFARVDHVHDASSKADRDVPVNTTASNALTAGLSNRGSLLYFTSVGAVTVTIPPQSSVAWTSGSMFTIMQGGTSQVTVAAGAGVTLRTPLTAKTRAQYSVISVIRIAANEWVLAGDLAVV